MAKRKSKKKEKVKELSDLETWNKKYIDMRAIVPSFVIALLWSLLIAIWFPAQAFTEKMSEGFGAMFAAPVTIASGMIINILLRAAIFVVDFVFVFFISYMILWALWREQDKRVYLQMKKKREL
jgi:hypothetical protein